MECVRWFARLPPSSIIYGSVYPDFFDAGPNLVGGGIREDRPARSIGKPDTHRQRIEYRTQLAFVAAQCLFRLLAVGNIHMSSHHAERCPGMISFYHSASGQYPNPVACLVPD